MSGVSASHLVIFIASIVVAAGVAGTLVTQVDRVSTSIADQSEDVEEQIDTDIRIISDTGSPDTIYDSGSDTLTLYVKNTGDTEPQLERTDIDVLIEGSFNSPDVQRVDDNDETGVWLPGTVIEVTVGDVDISGDTRVTVSVHENEDTIRFNADA